MNPYPNERKNVNTAIEYSSLNILIVKKQLVVAIYRFNQDLITAITIVQHYLLYDNKNNSRYYL